MSSIPDDRLFSHSDRVKGKVVIITGPFIRFSQCKSIFLRATRCCQWNRQRDGITLCILRVSTGIRPQRPINKRQFSAKVVIADLDITGANKVVTQVEKAGGFVDSGSLCLLIR